MRYVSREELFQQVWQTPMSRLAKEYGITGTGLAKICRKNNIPIPPRGYWAKVAAGHKVAKSKLPSQREGQSEKIAIAVQQSRTKPKREVIKLSKNISEVVQLAVPETMEQLHRLVRAWIVDHEREQKELQRRSRARSISDWDWSPEPLRDLTERDQYRFKVSSALFTAIEQAGASVIEAKINGRFRVMASGEEFAGLIVEKMQKKSNPNFNTKEWTAYPAHHQYGLSPSGFLRIEIEPNLGGNLQTKWVETNKSLARQFIAEIVGQIVAVGTILKDRRIRHEEAQRRYQQQQFELYEQRRREQLEAARFEALMQLANQQDDCESVLNFIARLRTMLSDNQEQKVEGWKLSDWIDWAEEQTRCRCPLSFGLDELFKTVANAKTNRFA